jgi:hypothetical protein
VPDSVLPARILESERAAAERIIARYSGGVAFIQGALGFSDLTGRPLRFLGIDERVQPFRDPSGQIMLSPEGKGPVAATPFMGSAFLVSRDGKIPGSSRWSLVHYLRWLAGKR